MQESDYHSWGCFVLGTNRPLTRGWVELASELALKVLAGGVDQPGTPRLISVLTEVSPLTRLIAGEAWDARGVTDRSHGLDWAIETRI